MVLSSDLNTDLVPWPIKFGPIIFDNAMKIAISCTLITFQSLFVTNEWWNEIWFNCIPHTNWLFSLSWPMRKTRFNLEILCVVWLLTKNWNWELLTLTCILYSICQARNIFADETWLLSFYHPCLETCSMREVYVIILAWPPPQVHHSVPCTIL